MLAKERKVILSHYWKKSATTVCSKYNYHAVWRIQKYTVRRKERAEGPDHGGINKNLIFIHAFIHKN